MNSCTETGYQKPLPCSGKHTSGLAKKKGEPKEDHCTVSLFSHLEWSWGNWMLSNC